MVAIVLGASGGIGAALVERLGHRYRRADLVAVSRSSTISVDLTREDDIEAFATRMEADLNDRSIDLVVNAAGVLWPVAAGGIGFGPSGGAADRRPEKQLKDLDPCYFQEVLAVNTIGPALLIKHIVPLLPRCSRSVMVHLSARVGSISDNGLGGWYAYRASKAALNQIVKTASIELRRTHPEAVIAALHPGTVSTRLSGGFQKTGLDIQSPLDAAERMLSVIDGLTPAQSGGFFDHHGLPIPW